MSMTLLALLLETETAAACLAGAAAAAAVDPAARLAVLAIGPMPERFILPSDEVLTERRRSELEAMLAARAARLEAAYRIWLGASGRDPALTPWQKVVAEAVGAATAERAGAADLVVMARPQHEEAQEALHAAIFDSGRPLLLVPPARPASPLSPEILGRPLAIAWKDSPPARRAVTAALPWLARATRVIVLMAGRSADAAPGPAADVLALLAGHGIRAEAVTLPRGGASIGAQLLAEVHARGAAAIVMGAYRHPRLVEQMLGGVTRHMLETADLPLFLQH